MENKNEFVSVDFTTEELKNFPVAFNFLKYANMNSDGSNDPDVMDAAYQGRVNQFDNTESFFSYSLSKSISLPISFDELSHEK